MQDGEKTEVKRNVEEYNMDETERRNEVKQELHQYTEPPKSRDHENRFSNVFDVT